MISEKMKPLVNNNSAIRMMFEEVNRLKAKYGAENVFDFSLGNPSVPAPDSVRQAIIDLVNELQVLELVKAYTRQRGTSTLLTLHDLNMAARYADRMVLLKDGVVFREGTPGEIITEENIRSAYGVDVHVHTSSRTGTPMLLPLNPVQRTNYIF